MSTTQQRWSLAKVIQVVVTANIYAIRMARWLELWKYEEGVTELEGDT
jgi:hypothetical protein